MVTAPTVGEAEEDELPLGLQGPLWHPVPQYAVVFPQYPFTEQQDPEGQFPQIVLPF